MELEEMEEMVELEELLLWLAASVGGSGRVMMWGTVEEGGAEGCRRYWISVHLRREGDVSVSLGDLLSCRRVTVEI